MANLPVKTVPKVHAFVALDVYKGALDQYNEMFATGKRLIDEMIGLFRAAYITHNPIDGGFTLEVLGASFIVELNVAIEQFNNEQRLYCRRGFLVISEIKIDENHQIKHLHIKSLPFDNLGNLVEGNGELGYLLVLAPILDYLVERSLVPLKDYTTVAPLGM